LDVGLKFRGIDAGALLRVARRADELGYESLWRGEHLVLPASVPNDYPYTEDGLPPFHDGSNWLDTVVLYAFVASVTSRIKFGTGVYVLPLRSPFVVARNVGTLDFLTGGRAILGVGAGWLREEFEIAGEDFDARGPRMDECIEVIRRLWTEQVTDFHGKYFSFEGARFEPKPVRKPHPPILVGGESPAAFRRAVRWGDGWFGRIHTAETAAEPIGRLKSLLQQHGEHHENFEICVRVRPDASLDDVRRLDELGVTRIVLEVGRPTLTNTDEIADDVERFADRVFSNL
jgi:probable F420-dependent oxidoreductase